MAISSARPHAWRTLLQAEGVAPGDRVAVQVEKSAENVFLYLACLKAGAVYLPLNTAYTDHELDYFFGDAEPRLIVCSPTRADGIRKLGSAKTATSPHPRRQPGRHADAGSVKHERR